MCVSARGAILSLSVSSWLINIDLNHLSVDFRRTAGVYLDKGYRPTEHPAPPGPAGYVFFVGPVNSNVL
jgi:hypothetical protein